MIDKDGAISIISKNLGIAKMDVEDVVNEFIKLFRDAVINREPPDEKGISTPLKINGFGKLTVKTIAARRGYDAIRKKEADFPEAIRVNFKLAKPIRYPDDVVVIKTADDEFEED